MSERNTYIPETLSRRDFLRLVGLGLGGTLLYLLGHYVPGENPPLIPETPADQTTPESLTTQVPIETKPPVATFTKNPTDTPEPSPSPIPKELMYASLFPEGTDLRKTMGAVDWTKPVTMIVPGDANIIDQTDVSIIFPSPLAVETEGSWDDLAPKTIEFNEWQDPEEKVMIFPSRPSAHPFAFLHAYQLKNGQRIFAGEYIRQAKLAENSNHPNPLIGRSWFFKQQNFDGNIRRTEMRFVHMTEMTADDLWLSPFYLDDDDRIMVDYYMAWKSDPQNPQEQLPLIPEQFRGPQHFTIATCNHGLSVIATLEVVNVEVVK
jgi:hypothetical protein